MSRRRGKTQTKRDKPRSRQPATSAQVSNAHPGGGGAAKDGGTGGSADEPQALVVTHRFDSGADGEPYSATVRLSGRRVGVRGVPRASDAFTHEEIVDGIVPGTGQVSITSWVYGISSGEWNVTAQVVRPAAQAAGSGASRTWKRESSEPMSRASWSWLRWSLSDVPATPVKTRWALLAPLARIPAVVPGSFTVLGALGILLALVLQGVIVARAGVSVSASLTVSLLALVAGLIAAKLWSRSLHPGEALIGPGWAVDGFLVVAPVVAVVAALAAGLPLGVYLDATAPGLFLAVAIGRVGCFFTGCCAGRCTSSWFGIWSSDRRIGARRIPTQLLESAAGLLIGGVAAALVLGDAVAFQGGVFLAAILSYFVIRQFLLRLRAEPRRYLWQRRRPLTPKGA